jgi:serine/threonine protein phosphatase PrpC
MGSYLSQPVTEKVTECGSAKGLEYACTGMQGWRTEMEDSHLIISDVGGNLSDISLFAVCMYSSMNSVLFSVDGHGGREVARFCSNWMPREIASLGSKQDLSGSMIRLYNR